MLWNSMGFVYRSSNPAEANFVEKFFVEEGLSCRTVPSAGGIGVQSFDVFVDGEGREELQARLRSLLEKVQDQDDEETTEKDVSETGGIKKFSLVGTLVVFAIAEIMRSSIYQMLHEYSPGAFTRFGEGLIDNFFVFLF